MGVDGGDGAAGEPLGPACRGRTADAASRSRRARGPPGPGAGGWPRSGSCRPRARLQGTAERPIYHEDVGSASSSRWACSAGSACSRSSLLGFDHRLCVLAAPDRDAGAGRGRAADPGVQQPRGRAEPHARGAHPACCPASAAVALDRALAGIDDDRYRPARTPHHLRGRRHHGVLRRARADRRRGRSARTSSAPVRGELVSEVERETGDDGVARPHLARGLRAAPAARGRRPVDGVTEFYVDYGLDRGRRPCRHARALPAAGSPASALLYALPLRDRRPRLAPAALPGRGTTQLTGLPNRPALYRARDPRDRRRARVRRARRPAADRPRPLQGGQRHARARPRRPPAARRRRPACAPRCARGDTLARLGGDEFAVLLHRPPGTARRRPSSPGACRARSRSPFVVERRHRRSSSASVGIALCPDHGADVEHAPCSAPTSPCTRPSATHAARARPTTPGATRTPPRRLQPPRRAAQRARHGRAGAALPAQGLDSTAASVTGVEALVRWQHPARRAARARRVPPARRGHRPDGRADALGRRRRAEAGERVAGRGHRGADRRQPRRRATSSTPGCPTWSPSGSRTGGVPGEPAHAASSPSTRVMADPRRAGEVIDAPARARRPALARRLRHGATPRWPTSSGLPLDEVKIDRAFVVGRRRRRQRRR